MSLKYVDSSGNELDIAGVGAEKVSDVEINGSSILDNSVANILTNTAYNSSTNKLATMTDINNVITKYRTTWGNDVTFYVPLGRQALLCCGHEAMYLLWNPEDTFHSTNIVGSGYSLTRDSIDKTKFRLYKTNGGNNTFSILVF